MAFCKACGQDIGDAAFCPKCGANQGAGAPATAGSGESPTAGIEENIAGLLCYLFHWVSGLIFLLLDKRSFVRFHAAQAIGFNIAAAGVWVALAMFGWLVLLLRLSFLGFLIFPIWGLFGFAVFATWIFLMYKAYQREKFKLPIIGDIVEKMIGT
jgi:uncharacterized membrane protein